MVRLFFLSLILPIAGSAFAQWQVFEDVTEDGTFIVAEQLGDGGVAWNFICFEGETFIELFMFDDVTPNTNNVNFLVAVDQQQPLRVGGFIDRVDDETIVFVGLDLNDNPARATQQLLTQIKRGNRLYLLGNGEHSDNLLSVEEWDLTGSMRALNEFEKRCQ